jgi:heat shock protein HslJ
MTDSPLRNPWWKLARLHREPVEVVDGKREPYLVFALDGARVSGSGGCNRITGRFRLESDALHFSHLASSKMACPAGMEQERRFLRALETVRHYRIHGHRLELLDASEAAAAEFEAGVRR